MSIYVLYHSSCWDGFGAAWSAWKRLGDKATYIPVSYGAPLPELSGCDQLYILDFSYPKETLFVLLEKYSHVTLLDHHKSAQADLEGIGDPPQSTHIDNPSPGLWVQFDMNESGASLAWEYFYKPDIPGQRWVPEIIKYVKDRDLWQFQMPSSKEISAWLHSFPLDFEGWNWLNYCLTDDAEYHSSVAEGKAILRSQQQQIETMCRHVQWVTLAGHSVPCVNATVLFSECGDYLCNKFPAAPFAAYYLDRNDGRQQWGLRSRNGFDVSMVAKHYGGGGHPAAAGFTILRPKIDLL